MIKMAKITYKGVTKECKYYKGLKWNKPLTSEMIQFEKETEKNAIWNGVITGTFEYWLYWRKKDKKIKLKPKPRDISKTRIIYRGRSNIKSRARSTQRTVSEETFYIKKRRGTTFKPVIEKHMLNKREVKYNWTEGQLYVDDKKIGEPDTIYGRDFLLYAKKYSPRVSPDIIQSNLMYNRDYAKKKGWNKYAKTIKEFADSLGVNIE